MSDGYDIQAAVQGMTQARVYSLLGQTMVEKITAQVANELLTNDVHVLAKQNEDLRAQLKATQEPEAPLQKMDSGVPQPRVRPPKQVDFPAVDEPTDETTDTRV